MDKNFFQGKKIFFRPYQLQDAALVCRWLNDESLEPRPATVEEVHNSIENSHNVVFIATGKDAEIGLAGLYDIDNTAKKAEIKMISGHLDTDCGQEIVELLTYFGFDRLNLNRIYSKHILENKTRAKIFEAAGYSREGIMRDDIYRNGGYRDSAVVAILRRDFEKSYPPYSQKYGH